MTEEIGLGLENKAFSSDVNVKFKPGLGLDTLINVFD